MIKFCRRPNAAKFLLKVLQRTGVQPSERLVLNLRVSLKLLELITVILYRLIGSLGALNWDRDVCLSKIQSLVLNLTHKFRGEFARYVYMTAREIYGIPTVSVNPSG